MKRQNVITKNALLTEHRGVDGIVVSNHAGRQVDGAVASLDALEQIVKAVGNETYVRKYLAFHITKTNQA